MKAIPISLILMIVRQLLKVISPELKKGLNAIIKILEEDADKTPNPWDNILVGLLKALLDVE